MKILFILTYYYPHWTGLTQYARRLAEGLTKKSLLIKVLTTKHDISLKSKERINGVEIYRKPFLFRLSRTLISPQFIFSFWNEIRNSDKVVIYLPFAEVLLASVIGKILNKPIYLVHNGDLKLPKGIINRIIEKFYYFSTEIAVNFCKAVIIQTQDYGNSSKLLSKYKSKWKVILPLFENKYIDNGETSKLREKIFPGKRYTVGFSGRFVEEKGFDILLKAIPAVLDKLPDTQFIFAGETKIPYEKFFDQNKNLVEQNSKNLLFLGRLDESQMPSFYKLCDVFVISSRSDCFPSVGIEAILNGVPLVVTDIPGARWSVKISGQGKIVGSEDPQALAEGIIEVLQNQKKYQRSRVNLKRIFDYQSTMDKYEKLLLYGFKST